MKICGPDDLLRVLDPLRRRVYMDARHWPEATAEPRADASRRTPLASCIPRTVWTFFVVVLPPISGSYPDLPQAFEFFHGQELVAEPLGMAILPRASSLDVERLQSDVGNQFLIDRATNSGPLSLRIARDTNRPDE